MQRSIILFVIIFSAVFLGFSFSTSVHTQAGQMNKQYAKILTVATEDAADTMEYSEKTNSAMNNKDVREDIVRNFFNSLATSFGENLANEILDYDDLTPAVQETIDEHGKQKMADEKIRLQENLIRLRGYVPAILMIDLDGYYIWHNTFVNGLMHDEITPLNTWSETIEYGAYTYYVRFFLYNYVEVKVKGEKGTFAGKPGEVKAALERVPGLNPGAAMPFLSNDSLYATERNMLVAQSTKEQLQYYINMQNLMNEADSIPDNKYVFEMPQISDGDWIEMIENPSVISFLQGIKTADGTGYVNIYSFSGGEYKKVTAYAATSDGYFHRFTNNPEFSGNVYTKTGEKPKRFYKTKREASSHGYNYCPVCNP